MAKNAHDPIKGVTEKKRRQDDRSSDLQQDIKTAGLSSVISRKIPPAGKEKLENATRVTAGRYVRIFFNFIAWPFDPSNKKNLVFPDSSRSFTSFFRNFCRNPEFSFDFFSIENQVLIVIVSLDFVGIYFVVENRNNTYVV